MPSKSPASPCGSPATIGIWLSRPTIPITPTPTTSAPTSPKSTPRYFPTTDILWASPECTNHSVAKGRKRVGSQPDLFGEILPDAAAERSRATMPYLGIIKLIARIVALITVGKYS